MTLVRRLRSTPLDAALAVVFAIAGLVQHVAVPIAGPVVGVLYVLGSSLPLGWRRTFPVGAAAVSSCFWLIPVDGFPLLGFVAVVLQFFSVGLRGRPRAAVIGVTVWAAVVSVVGTLLGPEQQVAAIGSVLVVVAPVVAGRLVAHQRRMNAELHALTEELQAERARAEQSAVEAERARIARELHDVVGHEVTLIAIQAEAAAAALRIAPDKAAEPVEAIRTTAHRTLTQMRQVLDVLAPMADDDLADDDLATLAGNARTAGIPNSLSVTGTPPSGRSPITLAVRRIVRECLTNAGRHAPGEHLELDVDWHPDRVAVYATNPMPPGHAGSEQGRGLSGMRHRTELLGGTFDVTETGSRFEVRVTIPIGAEVPR